MRVRNKVAVDIVRKRNILLYRMSWESIGNVAGTTRRQHYLIVAKGRASIANEILHIGDGG